MYVLIIMLVSSPTGSSSIKRIEFLEIKTRSGPRQSPVMKLGEKKEGRWDIVSKLKKRKIFFQEREGPSYGAKRIGHLQDTTYSWRQRVGEIQIGGRMSMQITEGWTIYGDFSLLQERCSDI